jgi:hypothetical protein
VPDLFPTDTPTPTEIREASVREIAEAMRVGMETAANHDAAEGRWLAAGLPATTFGPGTGDAAS